MSRAKENREIRQRIQHLLRHGHPLALGEKNKKNKIKKQAILMLYFGKEIFGFRLDFIKTEIQ